MTFGKSAKSTALHVKAADNESRRKRVKHHFSAPFALCQLATKPRRAADCSMPSALAMAPSIAPHTPYRPRADGDNLAQPFSCHHALPAPIPPTPTPLPCTPPRLSPLSAPHARGPAILRSVAPQTTCSRAASQRAARALQPQTPPKAAPPA